MSMADTLDLTDQDKRQNSMASSLDLTNQEKPRNSFTSSLDMTLTDEEKWRLRRKSMASSMDLSSVVISVTESSTILDSFKALMKKKDSGESKDQTPKNANTLVNEYSFDANDDGFDESLISSSLPNEQLVPTQISVDHFIIPAIFVRKSGTSDITMDIEATRLMIESTLTSSDEDLTFSSTINNSIISEADAAAIAREKNFKDKSPVVSGSGGSEGFDAGKMIAQQLSTLADEIEERARKKMEDIPSEVSSYVSSAMSQIRHDVESDSVSRTPSSWHHRSHHAFPATSTMVSTRKAANRARARPRRSSTSTLPSIGSIIPEEMYEEYDDDDDDDDFSYYEVHHIGDSDDSSYETDVSDGDYEEKLASATSRGDNTHQDVLERDIEGGNPEDQRDKSGGSSDPDPNPTTVPATCCDCVVIRCFEEKEEDNDDGVSNNTGGNRRQFKPNFGAYVVLFLIVFLVAIWAGIGIAWHHLFQSDLDA